MRNFLKNLILQLLFRRDRRVKLFKKPHFAIAVIAVIAVRNYLKNLILQLLLSLFRREKLFIKPHFAIAVIAVSL